MWRSVCLALACHNAVLAPGWWTGSTTQGSSTDEMSQDGDPGEPDPEPTFRAYFHQLLNRTAGWNFTGARGPRTFATSWSWSNWSPRYVEGWFWTGLDLVVSAIGWMIFGKSWTQVKTGVSVLLRLAVATSICVVIHYLFALCWPIVSLILGVFLTAAWLVRTCLKCFGRLGFFIQRLCGGVPEVTGASFIGPGTGETPETGDLRKLKKSAGSEDKWVLVKREGCHAIFKVTESSSIKAAGLYLSFDAETLRGDEALLKELRGCDKVHICRHQQCQEEGQHFKQYTNVPQLNAEKFQLQAATDGAQAAGSKVMGWFSKGASKVVQKAKDYASESEADESTCEAHLIFWEGSHGRERLSAGTCTASSVTEVCLLREDMVGDRSTCNLCPKHGSSYMKDRFQLKCAMTSCSRFGALQSGGLRLCEEHAKPTEPSRRSSRSRSRSRAREEPGGDAGDDGEDERERGGLRRRVRHQAPQEEKDEPMDAQDLLDLTKGEESKTRRDRRATSKRGPEGSPGRTPKSGVQRSLAKLGLVNSPDRREVQSTLEEFMEQLVDGKDLGLEEEDIRGQMAARYGLGLEEITRMLYQQATEEQRKGTKGLSKFLAKWRKQLAAETTPQRPRESSWSVLSTPSEGVVPSTLGSPAEPQPVERGSVSSPGTKPSTPRGKKLAVLGPPGIYGQDDRKAGTGGEGEREGMTELANAIKNQTSELATLVKAQHESNTGQGGTVKSLGKVSEELVFLLRACGQYTVAVGENEYGANLANALLMAQAGASTKLRNAGFRQKVTPRLAVGIAGPHWGTQEKHALSAADFTPCTDAELDQFAVESRTGKQVNEQRPTMPHRFEDWQQRVRRQNDIWALVYGKEWKAVREHAAELLGTWHQQAPHKWPMQVLIEVWEELHWRFVEELKAELRKIKALSGRESMTLQDLKFYALMPDENGVPPLCLPRTFDLQNPDGWFHSEVLPRIERRQERVLWRMTWEGVGKNRNPGQQAGGADSSHAGGDERLSLKTLLGPKLSPEESSKAKERAPTNREGKLLCWGFITHLGCTQGNCQRAHEHLRGSFESLDPHVRMQLLKRGGLKRMKQETKETAQEKIKELRAQVAKDKDSKVKEGQDRRRDQKSGGDKPSEKAEESRAGGVTWEAPEEMRNVDYTEQEAEFAEMVEGPNDKIYQHIPRDAKPRGGRQGETAPASAQELVRQAQRLAEGSVLKALECASDDLYAWAATRVANNPEVGLQELLEEMTQYGLGDLAAEAAKILEDRGDAKVGSARQCQIGEVHWNGDGPGKALVTIDSNSWGLYDYQENVEMTVELAGLLGVVQPEVEKRQCVTKVLAAGYLFTETGKLPAMAEVEHQAQEYRLEQARQAHEAEQIMGHAEAKVTPIEQELRMYTHDILKAHHDKDYRATAVFNVEHYVNRRLVVLRVNYQGDVVPEVILGTQWKVGQPTVWALVHRAHAAPNLKAHSMSLLPGP